MKTTRSTMGKRFSSRCSVIMTVVPSSELMRLSVLKNSPAAIGVKLRSRFIQKQKLRLHNRDRSKTEQLLLSAGQSGNRAVEPVSDAEKTCHLRNAHTHFSVIRAETFKSESQFVPNFIRHDLHLRILHNKSDLFGLFAKRQFFNGFSVKINCTALFAVLTQCRFTLPQKRALAAAGCTAYKNKLAGCISRLMSLSAGCAASGYVKFRFLISSNAMQRTP